MNKLRDNFIKLVEYDETEQVLDTRFLTHYWKVWDFVGLWPRRDGTKNFLSWLRYGYPRSLIALACFNMSIPCGIHLYQNNTDYSVATEVVCTMFMSLMIIIKISSYIIQESKFKNIYSIIERLNARQLNGNKYEMSVIKKSKYFSRLLTNLIAPFLTISVTVVCLPMLGVVVMRRIVPFQGWYPCQDKKASPCFELIVLFQVLVVATHFHTIMISDSLLVNILVQTLTQFKILCHNLESINEYSKNKIRTENDSSATQVLANSLREENEVGFIYPRRGVEITGMSSPISEHSKWEIEHVQPKPEPFTLSESVEKIPKDSRSEIELHLVKGELDDRHPTTREMRTSSRERIHEECALQVRNRVDGITRGDSSCSTPPSVGEKRLGNKGKETNSEHKTGAITRTRKHWQHLREPIKRKLKCTRFSANMDCKSKNIRMPKENGWQFRSGILRSEAQKTKHAVELWRSKSGIQLKQVDHLMERRLAECTRHHQTLLRLVSEIESVYQPYFVIQILCNLIPTSFGLYYFLTVPVMSMKDSIIIISLSFTLAELLMFCYLADEITYISSTVKDSVYACDWLEASEGFKRSMRIIISRSNDPFVFRVMRYLPLSMPLYAEVTRIAIKQFMVMKEIGEK